MAKFSNSNNQRLIDWISQSPRQDDPITSIDPCHIETTDYNTVIRCPVCFDIPRYPLITKCNHVICNVCFDKIFTRKIYNVGNRYFIKCPVCGTEIAPDDVHTYSQEKLFSPASVASVFYGSIRILCDNANCKEFIVYEELFAHEIFQCSQRKLKCPAQNCPAVGPPPETLQHTLDCALHTIWCGICYTRYSCVSYGHNCVKMMQRRLLLGFHFSKSLFVGCINHETGDILLPEHEPRKTPDLATLESFNDVVRLKRGMSLFRSYERNGVGEAAPLIPPAEEGGREPDYAALEAGALPPIVRLNLNEPARLDPDSNYDFTQTNSV